MNYSAAALWFKGGEKQAEHLHETKFLFDFPWNAVIETTEAIAILCDFFF